MKNTDNRISSISSQNREDRINIFNDTDLTAIEQRIHKPIMIHFEFSHHPEEAEEEKQTQKRPIADKLDKRDR